MKPATDFDKKVLIIAHGHPDINKGGAEIAAYNMFKEMEQRGYDAYFLARTAQTPHGGAAFSSRHSAREIMFHTTHDDWFLFSNLKTRHMWQEFRDLLLLIKPDVVHLHHYFLLGIELIEEIKQSLPNCKVIVTLHEYLAICNNQGLMVKPGGKRCYKASARDCHACLPDKQPGDYFLREKYIKRIFSRVDQFVSPSHFLRQRYVDWGLEPDSITVIENGQLPIVDVTDTKGNRSQESDTVNIAYFGQVNPYKGIDVLLEATKLLPKKLNGKYRIDIHGANMEHQKGAFKERIAELLEEVGDSCRFHGAYENHEMPALLANSDWVVIPSVWWENSPVVIQEAHNYQVPLIVSDIGGMAEKVTNNVDGIHFRVGSYSDLADKMINVITDKTVRQRLSNGIRKPLSIGDCVEQHLSLYS
ncbi:glycosyltransferase family 4 protein [Shewanella maritima]|uniref:glycosyltransferase family 4 protein n=1 Tax=Shewanella maritima TaxID=2520507 RepID=UPI00373703D0